MCWNKTAHHGIRTKATGGANLVAAQTCMCVTLTHTFHITLTHLQHQTQLLREQSLHHLEEKRPERAWNSEIYLTDFDIQMLYWPPTPSKGRSTSIPRFPAKAISSRQEMSPPSLTSCPALSRWSTSHAHKHVIHNIIKKNIKDYIKKSKQKNNLW